MTEARRNRGQYYSLGLALGLVTVLSATLILSCGDGGSSKGDLCAQCGDTDGPCRPRIEVSGRVAERLCRGEPSCEVDLFCRRKLGSAQRRCFPLEADLFYECDGARAFPGTVTPPPTTPTPVSTPTGVTPTATPDDDDDE